MCMHTYQRLARAGATGIATTAKPQVLDARKSLWAKLWRYVVGDVICDLVNLLRAVGQSTQRIVHTALVIFLSTLSLAVQAKA